MNSFDAHSDEHFAGLQEEKLRRLLLAGDDSPVKFNFLNFDPIPLPLDPEILIRRIIPEKVKIFKVGIRRRLLPSSF